MRVVIIGPGKVGCGHLTPLFADAGWEVVLAARTSETAERIHRAGSFRVRVAGDGARRVSGFRVVVSGSPKFERAVAGADLVCTAVGVGRVLDTAPALARGLAARGPESPVDVWVVENEDRAFDLETAVRRQAAGADLSLPPVGFAGAVEEAAIAHGDWREPGHPEFVSDEVRRLEVDAPRLVRPLPRLPGVAGVPNYLAPLQEKLFVFNAGHALCAYLGALRGHRTVDEAVRDPVLRRLVVGCLTESRKAVLRLHRSLGEDICGPVVGVLRRFENSALDDPIRRVARDPIRKLRAGDRLLGPARLVELTLGRAPAYFALGIAAALLYRADDDAESQQLERMLRMYGVDGVLQEVCGLDPDDPLARAVADRYQGFLLRRWGGIPAGPRRAHRVPVEAAG
jgi:mannitol-1-phosphate 5-dehydrogenase